MFIVGAIIGALISAATSIYTGEKQAAAQKRALTHQREAQKTSLLAQAGEERRARMAENKLNRRKPDIGSLVASESLTAGPSSTVLTGYGDGKKSLLGSRSTLGG